MNSFEQILKTRFPNNKITSITFEDELFYLIDFTREKGINVLMTSSFHSYEMPVPEKLHGYEFGQLYFCVPVYWDLTNTENPEIKWLFEWLNRVSTYTIKNNTWLGDGHTYNCTKHGKQLSPSIRQDHLFISNPIFLEDELIPVSREKALEVIEQVQALQIKFHKKFKSHFAWLADEWFLIAQIELPPESHYEDYPQIGNGVGSIRQFIKHFLNLAQQLLPQKIDQPKHFTWVVGNAVEKAFEPLVKQLNQVENLTISLAPLRSHYWGQEITVTGLLTGQDLIDGLQNQDLGEAILLPSLMLKHDDTKFLDDLTVEDVSQSLKIPIFSVKDVEELINYCIQPIS